MVRKISGTCRKVEGVRPRNDGRSLPSQQSLGQKEQPPLP